MITLENERTTSHPLGRLLFLRWFGIKQKLERCPVPSLSPVDEDNILLPLPKEPKCRLSGHRLDSQPGAIHPLVPSVLGLTVTRDAWSDIIRLVSVEERQAC